MALSLTEKVEDFAQQVKSFAIQAAESAKVKKLARALKNLAETLGDDEVEIMPDMILTSDNLSLYSDQLTAEEAENADAAQAIAKLARAVEVFIDQDILDDAQEEVASAALTLWAQVKPTASKLAAVKGTARGERASVPDFDFPIFATCEECGDVVKTGERSGVTDWNSLRHYSQRHGQNVHAASAFDNLVSNEWRNAKGAFASGEEKVVVEGSGDIPGFILERQEVTTSQVG